jgi:hypothetical protein
LHMMKQVIEELLCISLQQEFRSSFLYQNKCCFLYGDVDLQVSFKDTIRDSDFTSPIQITTNTNSTNTSIQNINTDSINTDSTTTTSTMTTNETSFDPLGDILQKIYCDQLYVMGKPASVEYDRVYQFLILIKRRDLVLIFSKDVGQPMDSCKFVSLTNLSKENQLVYDNATDDIIRLFRSFTFAT